MWIRGMMPTIGTFFVILFLHSIIEKAETSECNLEFPCGGNVTRKVCEERKCCFNPSSSAMSNCFEYKHSSYLTYGQRDFTAHSPPMKVGEKFPDDGIQLPVDLKTMIMHLANLTKTEAIDAVNKLEDYLKNETIEEGSSFDWDYGLDGVFSAFIKVSPTSAFQPIVFGSGTKIEIDENSGNMENGTVKNISRAIFVEYSTLASVFRINHNRMSCSVANEHLQDAPIISVTAFDVDWNKLSVPVTYSLKGMNTTISAPNPERSSELSCQYLNESEKKWLSAGCTMIVPQSSSMTCSCNHTTKFSMLFVIYPMNLNISAAHLMNIQKLEYVMESLSLTCLITTLGVLWLVRRRRSRSSSASNVRAGERTAVHANFVAALALLHFVRLFSDIAVNLSNVCAAVVVLSHYFMLASGMWMLIEGLLLYLNVIIRSMRNTALGVHKYWTGWGIPAIIVISSATYGLIHERYIELEETDACETDINSSLSNRYKSCWLSRRSNMIWAATGPLIVIFAANVFILAHTVIFVWRLNRKTDAMMPSDYNRDSKHFFWKTAKSILVLFPILGVPWIIGFMINIQHTLMNVIFQYLHVVLNGLQGFFVFVLYCIINKEARGIVLRVVSSRWEQHKVSVSASNTLARSTSGGSRKDRSIRGRRKSVSSNMGASEQYPGGTPLYTRRPRYIKFYCSSRATLKILKCIYNQTKFIFNSNVKSIGSATSQFSIYTLSMNRKQSSGSGSTTASACAQRINRIASGPTTGIGELTRHRPGSYMRAGSSVSLPRLGKFNSYKQVVRTGSVSSINLIGRHSSISLGRGHHFHSGDQIFICKACKGTQCIHAASDVAGLTEMQSEGADPVLLGYKKTTSLDSLTMTESQHFLSTRPRRMTAEEFKRFSAIPEEKRRSGINSFIAGDSNEYLFSRVSARSSKKIDFSQECHKIPVTVVLPENNIIETAQGENRCFVKYKVKEKVPIAVHVGKRLENEGFENFGNYADGEKTQSSIVSISSDDEKCTRGTMNQNVIQRLREEELQLKD